MSGRAGRERQYMPGEREAIKTVLALGAEHGYGNLIGHLHRAWSEMLDRRYGIKDHDLHYAVIAGKLAAKELRRRAKSPPAPSPNPGDARQER